MLHLPDHFLFTSKGVGGGVIQGTASEATLVAVLSARARAVTQYCEAHPEEERAQGALFSRLVAYGSRQAHSSVERAGLLAGVRMRLLEPDSDLCLRGEVVAAAAREDIAQGLIPFCVVATLGTTSSCAFDSLPELGPVCRDLGLWLHVDAAYAGSAFICPEFRSLLDGVELADSFNFNPHKWMLVNFDCSAMWFRDARLTVDAFNVDPVYLKHQHQGEVPDYRHWQIPLGRRFRSLKLWFVLRLYGVEGLQRHIREQVDLAQKFAELVRSDARFELPVPAVMGLVCFRLVGSNAINERLNKRINEAGKIHITPSKLREQYILRFAVCSRFTVASDIELAWAEICGQVEAMEDKPTN
jgi:aromatic-L-amino-acid decarboxylase